jgi:hypothetical protein
MGANKATEQLKHDLYRVVDGLRADLDRVEILIAALNGFGRPVPGYEPRFHDFSLSAYELGKRAGGER